MFDITGEDIAQLNDADLRTLVARLALAELALRRAPQSAITAGGPQDGADGGIDVRVELSAEPTDPDFVPRASTGFQVKKPDLAAKAIINEMRPGGVLRPSIAALAEAGGAYVIASSGADLTDSTLQRRRDAMREAVADHPAGANLFVDVYDRSRLATWVNQNPGVAAWLRRRSGRPLSGWSAIGAWRDLGVAADAGYLIDESLTLIDEREGATGLPIADGIVALREALSEPGRSVRLIGLSGLGKTRLVQALFEAGVGEGDPLDAGMAVYADYADATTPSAREMASRLVEDGGRALLIVDNCNAATHGQLAELCGRTGSQVSLLTVEYDIRDDEPERTEVFRLVAASDALIEAWLKRDFPDVSAADRGRIAKFSGGNFRVARALAGTLRPGEGLGRLRDQDLFERIFLQRNDPDQTLLLDAQMLSLFYSIDITEGPEGELAPLATFAGRTVQAMYGSLAELQARGVLQARGRWRAVLPHAIANPLAAATLKRLPPQAFDAFCAALPERMRRSLSRRLGFLHDVPVAREIVTRWLDPAGPAGDVLAELDLAALTNIAPVDPSAVLARLEAAIEAGALDRLTGRGVGRGAWTDLLKALAYEPELFDRAAGLMARFIAAEAPDENFDSARSAFGELFQLYLSGTRATPEQRRVPVLGLLRSADPGLRRAGRVALDSLMKADQFSAISLMDFGARSRDYGWHPSTWPEIEGWYEAALDLVRDGGLEPVEERQIFAEAIRPLWRFDGCRSRLAAVAESARNSGWVEGWLALRVMLHYDGADMPAEVRALTEAIIAILAPRDLVAKAQAYVLSSRTGAWDAADAEDEDEADPLLGWRRVEALARDVGVHMAGAPNDLEAFLPQILSANSGGERAIPFGSGLAEGSTDLTATWAVLTTAFAALDPDRHNPTVLGNFLRGAMARDPAFGAARLDDALADPVLGEHFAFLQVVAGLDGPGVDRMLRAIERAGSVEKFRHLANIDSDGLPSVDLVRLLDAIAGLPGGPVLGLDMVWRHFHRSRDEAVRPFDPLLVDRARHLLTLLRADDLGDRRDYPIRFVAKAVLAGPEGRDAARAVSQMIYAAHKERGGWRRNGRGLAEALFRTQPELALDVLVDGDDGPVERLFESQPGRGSPLDTVPVETLLAWAELAPERRYARLGEVLSLFHKDQIDSAIGLNPVFIALLEQAPDKAAFLGDAYSRLHPNGWSGSLAAILAHRLALLEGLPDHPDITAWRMQEGGRVAKWIAGERQQEAEREESFE